MFENPEASEPGPLASSRAITKLPTREFHVFLSAGSSSGESTQIRFEVDDIDTAVC